MHNKDEIGKGKDDWMDYVNKRKQIKEDRVEDKKNQEKKIKAVEKVREKRKTKPEGGGFQLG